MMDVSYTKGPRILENGVNLDADIVASFPQEFTVDINDAVTGLTGRGYQPGQSNLDETPL